MSLVSPIIDNYNRPVSYLRLAVTDRCNLRCYYCMPKEGVQYLARKELLTYEEMLRLTDILSAVGVNKVRITGGEPFLRKDIIHFLHELKKRSFIEKVSITTNGLLTDHFIPDLLRLDIKDINLSLDTLDAKKFYQITRRDEFSKVQKVFHKLLENGFNLKLNMVVMNGINEEEVQKMAALTKEYPIHMRYIEEMPFNGKGLRENKQEWDYRRILNELQKGYPEISGIETPENSTSQLYKIPGHEGIIGIIPAYSRTFCGSCNRIRLTSQGLLKTCLYDKGIVDIKKLMRNGASDKELLNVFIGRIKDRYKNGFEAESDRQKDITESMSAIGG